MAGNGFAFRRVKQPRNASPLVRALIELMNEQGVGVFEMCAEAGIGHNTFFNWAHSTPRLDTIEACFNVLGYTLKPVATTDVVFKSQRGSRWHPKEFLFTSPEGRTYRVKGGMRKFCLDHGFNIHAVYTALSPKHRTHVYKGWTVRRG